ncbi:uncharacterized protein LOC119386776 [Rhipicephalus sanguineus]|uniref:Uncharacterized protein n=1 Tax=Rhipicephalus sanguineus TaxID=34632 RepID=A0A9D4Q3I5_RHISA|nr:uncharacterized protein LOC119386776 [Rhipicephalus sanguineus]KAH7963677.1 hypothetical protein HPB52_022345 [Rhipicephalus sanguineus]
MRLCRFGLWAVSPTRVCILLTALLAVCCDAYPKSSTSSKEDSVALGTGRGLPHRSPVRRYRHGRRLDAGPASLPRRARVGASGSTPVVSDYDADGEDYPPYYNYWPPSTDKRKDKALGGYHPHRRHHRQGKRRYDEFDSDYYYDSYVDKHDYKNEYDIVFPLLILIMAPLAVSAFLLPITASLMTNTFFLVNGATSAAIQGRRRRSVPELVPSAEELNKLEEVLVKAIEKYAGLEGIHDKIGSVRSSANNRVVTT